MPGTGDLEPDVLLLEEEKYGGVGVLESRPLKQVGSQVHKVGFAPNPRIPC